MAGKFALIIANSHYDDPSLSRLKAPDVDVRALETVLKSSEVMSILSIWIVVAIVLALVVARACFSS
jgi:hypothetical protein